MRILQKLLADQQNPQSANYHRWLTPEEYADRFGVSPGDLDKITSWLRSEGLTIANVARGRSWVAVNGSAAQVEAAFQTEIHQYLVNGETHFANATEPSVPAAIGPLVLGIRGLHNFRMRPLKFQAALQLLSSLRRQLSCAGRFRNHLQHQPALCERHRWNRTEDRRRRPNRDRPLRHRNLPQQLRASGESSANYADSRISRSWNTQ